MNEDDRAELDRLLPAPGTPGLSADRHRLLRGHLMSEIGAKPARARRSRYGWVALPALAGGLALAVVLTTGGGGAPDTPGAAPRPAVSRPAAGPADAVQLLDRIAQVSASRPGATVRDDQYVCVRSEWSGARYDAATGRTQTTPTHPRTVWLSVDGSANGLIEDATAFGRPENPRGRIALVPAPGPAGIARPTYHYLTTLPTDPRELLGMVYAEGNGKGGQPDQAAFRDIGNLISEQLIAPETSAAFYRAAALIPGVTLVDDAVDALGRHGVAVAREDGTVRSEWIFDRTGYEFLGEREVLLRDSDLGPKGMVVQHTAVQQRAVVDKPGELPAN
ncbi:CU044_5270 family protein [Kitasatospora sp. NPDC059327]|uniref:CU044_5270 family protein n=1 Tax=Kitasatospora sp. NPDC059327 TaxID=3346803 RepID=UPI0036904BD8